MAPAVFVDTNMLTKDQLDRLRADIDFTADLGGRTLHL